MRVVPKGLRAFDVEDADFFLTLVPGPRDRDGLPEAIRSWKRRIEERDPGRTFSVGLLYGPSGSGKSSLVKAGLIPRLSHNVRAIYVEASPGGTEAAIAAALVREFPDLAALEELELMTAALRAKAAAHRGVKVLLVLDQFEQWLESHREVEGGKLTRALRQCDGLGLQALLLVRDDFWMATTRFLKELEIRLLEGVNSAPVELFNRQHAAFVLAELGRALGRMSEAPIAPGSEEARFIEWSVAELANPDGRVIPVRLTLFAEMIRHRDWTMKTLRELGGINGIGEIFLEESFSARRAPMPHRVHERAAQSVLKALLPDSISDIRDRSKPVSLLREASGYADRPIEFNELMYILDNELRMVTAVDPISPPGDASDPCAPPGETLYQLTHDYLVPSLRQWLTSKQRQTRRGRAELQLAMITAHWCDRPSSRRLPSLMEWLKILIFTQPRTWSTSSRRMMKRAMRHFVIRAVAAIGIIGAVGFAVATARSRDRAQNSLQTARTAEFASLPELLNDLSSNVAYLRPDLERLELGNGGSPRDREVATLVLYRDQPTPSRAVSLLGWLLTAVPDEVKVIGDALAEHTAQAGLPDLNRLPLDESAEPGARLRAACVLARLEPASATLMSAGAAPLAEALLAEHPRTLARWIELLGDARTVLVPALSGICCNRSREASAQSSAAEAVADILVRQNQTAMLARLIADATPEASNVLLRELVRVGPTEAPIDTLRKILEERKGDSEDEEGKDAFASRQASAAVALAALGQPDSLWPLLRHRDDPRLRTCLIQRLAVITLTSKVLIDRLSETEIDPVERQANLLAWAEMPRPALSNTLKAAVIARARMLYLLDPDPGVHSAAELVLVRWGEPDILEGLQPELESSNSSSSGLRWAIGPNAHTFAILKGPLEFWMGSPPRKVEYYGAPVLHYRKIDRSIMVATKEVTLGQFQKYQPAHRNERRYGESSQCAATRISWHEAAAYCNWLSAQAGIPRSEWCYPENPQSGMTISEDSVKRTGFRLPTEAEWEYFCRGGTNTSRPFGESAEFLSRHAWTWLNSDTQIHPPGQLLPNELGLFDVLGNAWEWCQDGPPGHYIPGVTDFPAYPAGTKEEPAADPARTETVDAIDRANETWRIVRGGAFSYSPDHSRSAYRDWQPSKDTREYLGIRVVRTLSPGNR